MNDRTPEKPSYEQLLTELRGRRDQAAASEDHAEALILNDRIRGLKNAPTRLTVERVMQTFERALAKKRSEATL